MQKITPFLWFNTQAEEAANFYTSIFKDSKVGGVTRYDDAGAKASGMRGFVYLLQKIQRAIAQVCRSLHPDDGLT